MTEPVAGRGQRRRRSARREQGPPAEATATPAAAKPDAAPPDQTPDAPRQRRADRPRSRHRHRVVAEVEPVVSPVIEHHPSPAPVFPAPARSAPRTVADRRAELADRALRGLVTSRGTQVSWSAGVRARDVARPSAQEMADAEAEVVIVRRNYTPPEPLAGTRGTPEVIGKQRRSADRARPNRER